jgi:hypothetical protein
VVNAITALENLFSENNEKNLKDFFVRHDLPLDQWKSGRQLDSITVCLNLLHLLHAQLKLDSAFTERLINHYNRRNNIVHHGTLNVPATEAESAIEDVYYLGRCLLGRFDFTVSMIFAPKAALSLLSHLPLIQVSSRNKSHLTIELYQGLLVGRLLIEGLQIIKLEAPIPIETWQLGQKMSIAISYESKSSMLRLLLNDMILTYALIELNPSFDSSSFRGHSIDKGLGEIVFLESIFMAIHERAVPPEDFRNLDNLFTLEEEEEELESLP